MARWAVPSVALSGHVGIAVKRRRRPPLLRKKQRSYKFVCSLIPKVELPSCMALASVGDDSWSPPLAAHLCRV